MSGDQWEKLKRIFSDALEQPRDTRDTFVKQACIAIPELLPELQRLLAEYELESSALSHPALGDAQPPAGEHPPRFSPGMILAGRFHIIEFIARGGMGEVYEAEDLELGEHVALKTIRPDIAEDERVLALFKTEIQLARRVTHPNVCRIYDLEQHVEPGSKTTFLSMELLQGQTLAQHLRACGPFTAEAALPLIRQMAAALQAAHDAGVIHRDFKPGNVMLVPEAEPNRFRAVVTDFGLALPALRTEKNDPESADRGTPHYMAPEQRDGAPITSATDVYSLALVIASMLGARRPASEVSHLRALVDLRGSGPDHTQLNLPPSARRWRPVLMRCVERDAARRYSRPAEVAAVLSAASRGRFRVLPAVAAVLSVGIGLAALSLRSKNPAPAPAPGTIRPVWTGDDVDNYGRISPDGRLLSFIDWSTRDVAVRNVDTGEKRRVTQNRQSWPGGAGGSLFSPDSRRLAYVWSEDGWPEIRTIGADGSGVRTLFRAERKDDWLMAADWSADGKYILAILGPQRQPHAELLVIDAENTSVRPIPTQARFSLYLGALFSPDGKYIAYDDVPPAGALRLIELATMRDSALWKDPGTNRLVAWSPDGARIMFASDRSGAPGLWALPVRNGQAKGDPEALKLNTAGWISSNGITRNGTLFYDAEANTSEVYIAEIDPGSGRLVSVPKPLSQRYVESKGSMIWSPDGSALLFDSSRSGKSGILVIHSMIDGTEREVFPELLNVSLVHKWHPDGGSVFVDGTNLDHVSGLFRVDLTTGKAQLVAADLPNDRPGFSKDARTIYYMQRQQDLVARSLQSGVERVLYTTDVPHALRNPNVDLSPDGRRLVFQLQNVPEGYDSVAVMPAAGGKPRILLSFQNERILGRALIWSADSRYIFMSRGKNNRSTVWRISADGGPAKEIGLSMPGLVRMLRLHPDGRHLAFLNGELKDEIWAMENVMRPARAN